MNNENEGCREVAEALPSGVFEWDRYVVCAGKRKLARLVTQRVVETAGGRWSAQVFACRKGRYYGREYFSPLGSKDRVDLTRVFEDGQAALRWVAKVWLRNDPHLCAEMLRAIDNPAFVFEPVKGGAK